MNITLNIFDSKKEVYKTSFYIIITFIILMVMDSIWFSLSYKSVYKQSIANVTNEQNTKINWWYGILAWFFIAIALSVQRPSQISESIVYGLLIGVVIYGTFNATTLAIFNGWSLKTSIYDILWGTLNCMFTSIILYYIFFHNDTENYDIINYGVENKPHDNIVR